MSNTATILNMLVLGLLAGVLSGMFGIGGGLVIVPALIIVFGFGPKVATGTSLFALMWPVGLLGVLEYWRRDELRAGPGALIAVGLFIGAHFGARITGAISAITMKQLYGAFLLIMGSYFLVTANCPAAPARLPKAEPRPAMPASYPDGPPPTAPVQVQRPPDLS